MIRVEREVRISRPRADVFAYLTDPERIPDWQGTVVEVARETDGPLEVGARWRETRVFMGRRIEQTVETTIWEPDEEFAVAVVDGPVPLRVRHLLSDDGDATLVRVTGEAEPSGMFRFGARLIVPAVERQFDQDFARLREVVEAKG